MEKKNLLCWSDAVTAGTGFGVVSKQVFKHLNKMFNIDHLAINYQGEFLDKDLFPYQVIPARLEDPKDPYGNLMFLKAVASGKYDAIWIMNDLHVVEKVGKELPTLLDKLRAERKKIPKIVFYYPVDCQVLPNIKSMLDAADIIVPYCEFGKQSTLKIDSSLEKKMRIINHGVDSKVFFPLPDEERTSFRQKFFDVKDPETFVWMSVNRNSVRKDIARTILAFAEFKKRVYNKSVLYLHTAPRDTTIDLFVAVKDAGLTLRDVIFPNPKQYSAAKPYPENILNYFYNSGHAFITTTLGEGWGLTHLEAASAGLPVVCPFNTCFPEQLANGNRGYLYECKEKVWIDNSGYRPIGLINDIVDQMEQCFNDVKSNTKSLSTKQELMNDYLASIQWDNIGQEWIKLFIELQLLKNNESEVRKITGEVL